MARKDAQAPCKNRRGSGCLISPAALAAYSVLFHFYISGANRRAAFPAKRLTGEYRRQSSSVINRHFPSVSWKIFLHCIYGIIL